MSATYRSIPILFALLLAGCADSGSLGTQPGTPEPSPTSTATVTHTPTASPTASPAATGTMQAVVYYLHDLERGPRLQKEVRTVPRSPGVVRAAVDAMLHLAPLDPDYTSLWPKATQVRGVSVSGDLAKVDLSGDARKGRAGSEYEELSLQQLVHTVTAAAPAVKRVQLLVEGKAVADLWGHSDTSKPLTRGDHNSVLAPISVESPRQGANATRTLTFKGSSNTFEANLLYRVTRTCQPGTTCSAGQPVYASSHTTATSGTGTRGTWSVTVTLPPAASGNWVEIRAFEASAQDGSEQFADTKVVRIA